MSHAKRQKTTAGGSSARAIASEELKAVGGRDAKVQWGKIPTDVLMRTVATFLRVAEARKLQTTEKRLAATIKAGAVSMPVVELGDEDFESFDYATMQAYAQHIPVWSQQTEALTLRGNIASLFNWFQPDTFLRLKKLEIPVPAMTATRWHNMMIYCPQLVHLDANFYGAQQLDLKLAETHNWTIVRTRGATDSRFVEFCTAFANRHLQVFERPTRSADALKWTLDASKAFVAKLQPGVFRRWQMDVALDAHLVNEHILFLLKALPAMDKIEFGSAWRPLIVIETLEAMLETWTCLTTLRPLFVALPPDSIRPTLRLPAKRAWTELRVTQQWSFAQWSLQHLLPMVQRSDQWSWIEWDQFAPDDLLDSKMLGAVLDQLKAPVETLSFYGPVLPSHDSIVRLGSLKMASKRFRNELQLGPHSFIEVPTFGQHLLTWDDTPRTNLTSATLLEFLTRFSDTNRDSDYKVSLRISYAPLHETTDADLFAIFYTERVHFGFWLPTAHLNRFRAAYLPNHPILARVRPLGVRGLFTYVTNPHVLNQPINAPSAHPSSRVAAPLPHHPPVLPH